MYRPLVEKQQKEADEVNFSYSTLTVCMWYTIVVWCNVWCICGVVWVGGGRMDKIVVYRAHQNSAVEGHMLGTDQVCFAIYVPSANHSSSSFSSSFILLFLIIHQNYFQCTT